MDLRFIGRNGLTGKFIEEPGLETYCPINPQRDSKVIVYKSLQISSTPKGSEETFGIPSINV
jgi:hypothetical protein